MFAQELFTDIHDGEIGATQGQVKLHAVLSALEDEASSSTVAQWLTVLEDKMGEIAIQLRTKNE